MLFRYKNPRKFLNLLKANYLLQFQAEKNGDEYEVILEISPEEGSKYELIVDYAIIVDNECKFVSFDFVMSLFLVVF